MRLINHTAPSGGYRPLKRARRRRRDSACWTAFSADIAWFSEAQLLISYAHAVVAGPHCACTRSPLAPKMTKNCADATSSGALARFRVRMGPAQGAVAVMGFSSEGRLRVAGSSEI
jgi:hypothetical protein